MRFKLFYIIPFLILLVGCGTDADFERDNEDDPKADNFKPDAPSFQQRQITEDKIITLSWNDETDFEDGYLIEKKIYAEDDFETVDTLSASTRSYTDDSKLLAPGTSYRISSFVYSDANNDSNITKNSSEVINLSLRPLGELELYDRDQKISVNWQNELEYFDAILFGYKDLTNDGKEIVFTDTLTLNETSLQEINNLQNFDINTPSDGFSYEIIVMAAIRTPDDKYTPYSAVSNTISVNQPTITSLNFLDEETLEIRWDNDVPDVEQFEIYEGFNLNESNLSEKLIASVASNVTSYNLNRTLADNQSVGIGIRAKKNDDYSKIASESVRFLIRHLRNFKIVPQENSVKLSWEIPHYNPFQPYTRFIVERSINNKEDFETYKELSPDIVEYIDVDISRSQRYYYRVRSASSRAPQAIGAVFETSLSLENKIPESVNPDHIVASSEHRKEITWINNYPENNTITFSDTSGRQTQYYDPEFRFFSIKYSADERFLILTGDPLSETVSNSKSYSKIFDRDTMTELLSIERNNVHSEDLLVIPRTDKIVMNQFYIVGEFPNKAKKTDLDIININTDKVSKLDAEIDGFFTEIIINSKNNNLLAFNFDSGQILIYDLTTLQQINSITIAELRGADRVKLNEESNKILFPNDEHLFEFDLKTNAISILFSAPDRIGNFIQFNNEKFVAFLGLFAKLYLYNKNKNTITVPFGGYNALLIDYWKDTDQLLTQNSDKGTQFFGLKSKWTIIQ